MIKSLPPGETPQPRPDGSLWPYAMVDLSGSTHCADSASDIINLGLSGYADLDPESDDALAMRYDDLVSYAYALQQSELVASIESESFDPAAANEAVLTALFSEKLVPFEPEADGLPMEWPDEYPTLFLIATDYAPFTTRPTPSGNVTFLDPSTELTYLHSLNDVGVIHLLVAP